MIWPWCSINPALRGRLTATRSVFECQTLPVLVPEEAKAIAEATTALPAGASLRGIVAQGQVNHDRLSVELVEPDGCQPWCASPGRHSRLWSTRDGSLMSHRRSRNSLREHTSCWPQSGRSGDSNRAGRRQPYRTCAASPWSARSPDATVSPAGVHVHQPKIPNYERQTVSPCPRSGTDNPSRYHLFTYWWHYPAMETTGRVLGPASTNFNDYLGTVAADDTEAVLHKPSLYELADLDRDRYTILAVDLRVEGRTTATVYAIDRVQHPDAVPSEIATRNQNQGDVPVVPFDLPEASAEEFMKYAFSRISFRLVTQLLHNHALVVAD
jgi:hypothetical protein